MLKIIKQVLFCAVCLTLVLASAMTRPASAVDAPTPAPRRVKVLFLGDTGHHDPLERCRNIYSVLAKRGVDITYMQDLSALEPQTLNQYDVLLLYANWLSITPAQEKSLLNFVESGHGLAAIHCASYCFLNSPKFTALVGARFKSHKTGVFKETIAEPGSVIEKGLNPIESWDETYVHEMHNEVNRDVVSYRVEGDHREPYTWTRTQGKGRVFYTAWGHDQRTWGNADFQALLERGIRWSAGGWALQPQPALAPFTYVDAKIPNYINNGKWGTTAQPLSQMQEPISPQESMKHMALPPGFDVKLVTSEPDVKKPITLAFDERGRLWVAETFDYPNNMQKPGQGHDQITICESSKSDGVADKFTVFADKLSIPTSMVFANGGVIVAQAPDFLFLKDTKGDGHADVRKVLFHGWGTRDTHAGPSHLQWGFDNWIYGTVGYSGFDGEVNGEHLQFGQGVYRFKPDGSKLEFLGSTTNNTWGLSISEDDEVVGSTANGVPAWYLHIPNRYYEQVSGWPATRLESIADSYKFWAMTDKVRQVDWFGGYTAGAGSALYTARSFPQRYWNRIAFVCEPTGHIVGQFVYERRGSDFAARDDFNLLASDDEWTAPIAAEVGPDGALWVIDWYNYIVQHNPIPQGWRGGKGGAYETDLRDKRHGRVYRVIYTPGTPSKSFDLHDAPSEKLIEALQSDNMLWRMHAQRLLVERADKSVIPALAKLVANQSVDELGLNPAAVHALWTIDGLGGTDLRLLADALHHPSGAVRKAAVDVMPRTSESIALLLKSNVLNDSDAQVRKSALLALAEMPATSEAGAAVYATLIERENLSDRWIPDAATIAGSRHDVGFLRAMFAAHANRSQNNEATQGAAANPTSNAPTEKSDQPRRSAASLANIEARVIRRVVQQYARRAPADSIVATLQSVGSADPSLASLVLNGLSTGWPKGMPPALSDADADKLKSMMTSLPPSAQDGLLALATRWGRADLFAAQAAKVVDALKTKVADTSASAGDRSESARRLIAVDDSPTSTSLILKQINPAQPPDVQLALLTALSQSRQSGVGAELVDQYGKITPSVQRECMDILIRRTQWTNALLDGIKDGKINNRDLLPQQWTTLRANPDEAISSRARELQKASGFAPNTDRAAIVAKFAPIAERDGDPVAGKAVFEGTCMLCHTLEGKGGKVGPDLTGIGAKPKADLLHKILDPNSSVEGTYKQWIVRTKSGDVIAGRITAENRESLELIDSTAKIHEVQRDDIDRLVPTPKTLMPEGLEQLGEQKLTDLLSYLATSKVKK